MSNQADFISLDGAAKALSVHRTMMYYYVKQLSIETKRFPLDRRRYIAIADLNKIKSAKEAAVARASQEFTM